MTDLTFEPPGPGTWTLNDLHLPRPATRYKRSLEPSLASDGARAGLATYGVLFDIEVGYVNGFQYMSRQPVDGTPAPEQMPDSVDDLPHEPETEFQRRVLNGQETFETRRWRTDLERWDDDWKPSIRATNRSLQEVTPSSLDDDELVQHLNDCRDAYLEHGELMFRILPCALIPQSDFLTFVREQTDLSPEEVIPLFAGATPVSQGAVDELRTLVSAIGSNPHVRRSVFSDDPPGEIIDQLRTAGNGVGKATAEWLSEVGYRRISGFDLDANYLLERPAVLVNTLRTALEDGLDPGPDHDESADVEAIRRQIPPESRADFDERYEEARLTYRVQDERALHTSATGGLLRRALMEAGERLAVRGRLRDADHVLDMEHGEIVAALRGEPAPSAAEVAAHVSYRQTHHASEAPDTLGAEESTLPDPAHLPEPMARVMRAFESRRWANEAGSGNVSEDDVVTGHGASDGTAQGPARIVAGPDDFDRLQDGDILVTEITSPAFNIVLPMIEGIVTDTGGMLSHPAIVAREFGIPGVVGCEDATDRIADGDRIVVDGEEGTVRIASRNTVS